MQSTQQELKGHGENDYRELKRVFEDADVVELFGDTGTGKTTFAHKVAHDAIKSNASVLYVDTERNLSRSQAAVLGDAYRYVPIYKELSDLIHALPKKGKTTPELVVIDSIGFPVLARFSRMDLRERGGALLDMIGMLGSLKEWAYVRGDQAIVTNQPISEMAEAQGKPHRAFGDKAQFGAKELLEPFVVEKGPGRTLIHIKAHRSRQFGFGTLIAAMVVSDSGVSIEWVT